MSGLLNTGLTGLNAAQANLLTTGHNITNAGVAGYHRQTVIQSNNTPLGTGVGFFGRGTQIETITRSYSQYLENQVSTSANRLAEYNTYNQNISQINNLLADSTSGMSPALEKFFAGVQEVASNPTSVAARQTLISSAQALVSSFQTMDARLTEVRQGVEGQISTTVDQINMYAGAIAEMNNRIMQANIGGGHVPNDLLDQREMLIAGLNELVKVNAVTDANGAVSIFIGTGQSLVVGTQTTTLAAVPDPNDPQRNTLALMSQNGVANLLPEKLITGGSLGGLIAFRNESLDPAQNQLGLIALGIAETFNAQHALGVDLNGELGGEFFKSPAAVLKPAIAGSSAVITDVSALTASDYLLRYDTVSGAYTLKTLTGESIPLTQNGNVFSGGGMEITIGNLADIPSQGLLIQPTRYAARDLLVGITDPRKVAAGDPVSAALTVGPGDGVLSSFVTDVKTLATGGIDGNSDGTADFAPITLQYDSAAGQLVVSGGTIERYDPATDTWVAGGSYDPNVDTSGARFRVLSNPADPEAFAFEFTAKGDWQPADATVTFSPSVAGVADNRNAVALGALQTTKVLLASAGGKPTATFQATYAALVTSVGNKTREVQVNQKAQEALLDQAQTARDSLSAVNLDEEAANLIRYQQAYQAASKVMSIAQTLFDEVLSIAR